jgi:hypothetical protein
MTHPEQSRRVRPPAGTMVLVVDDEVTMRMLVGRRPRTEGSRVWTAAGAGRARGAAPVGEA